MAASPTSLALLAQGTGGAGQTTLTVFLLVVLVLIWTALGVVCWIFWRAKRREDTERALTAVIPERKWATVHHQLIHHGREVCKAIRPLCERCPLRDLCDYYEAIHEHDRR